MDKDYLILFFLIIVSGIIGYIISNFNVFLNFFSTKEDLKSILLSYYNLLQSHSIYAKIVIKYDLNSNILSVLNSSKKFSQSFVCQQYLSKDLKEVYCNNSFYSKVEGNEATTCIYVNNTWKCYKNINIPNKNLYENFIQSLENMLNTTEFKKVKIDNMVCFKGYVKKKDAIQKFLENYFKGLFSRIKNKNIKINLTKVNITRVLCFKKENYYIPYKIEEDSYITLKMSFYLPMINKEYSWPIDMQIHTIMLFNKFIIDPKSNPIKVKISQ